MIIRLRNNAPSFLSTHTNTFMSQERVRKYDVKDDYLKFCDGLKKKHLEATLPKKRKQNDDA